MKTTRRTALKIMGGALIVPSLRVRPDHDLHRILTGFCDLRHETSHYDLTSPFVVDGMAYGTDGRIAARIVSTEYDTSDEWRRLPLHVNDAWESQWLERGQFRPLPPERLVEGKGICPQCCEEEYKECEACQGSGCELTASGEDVTNCRKCHGRGYALEPECPLCKGRRCGRFPCHQPLGNKLISVDFYRRLLRVPGLMWSPGRRDPRTAIVLKSDIGIEALAMPCYRGMLPGQHPYIAEEVSHA